MFQFKVSTLLVKRNATILKLVSFFSGKDSHSLDLSLSRAFITLNIMEKCIRLCCGSSHYCFEVAALFLKLQNHNNYMFGMKFCFKSAQ